MGAPRRARHAVVQPFPFVSRRRAAPDRTRVPDRARAPRALFLLRRSTKTSSSRVSSLTEPAGVFEDQIFGERKYRMLEKHYFTFSKKL